MSRTPSTPRTFRIDAACLPVTLCAGAELSCHEGTLWLTMETRQTGRSADIVLAAGQRYGVTRDGQYFLTALRHAGVAVCEIRAPAASGSLLARWRNLLPRTHWSRPA